MGRVRLSGRGLSPNKGETAQVPNASSGFGNAVLCWGLLGEHCSVPEAKATMGAYVAGYRFEQSLDVVYLCL